MSTRQPDLKAQWTASWFAPAAPPKKTGLIDQLIDAGRIERDFVLPDATYRVATDFLFGDKDRAFRCVVLRDGVEIETGAWAPVCRDLSRDASGGQDDPETKLRAAREALECHLRLCARVARALEKKGGLKDSNRLSPREETLRKYFRKLPPLPDYRIAHRWMGGGGALAALGFLFWLGATSACGRFVLGTVLVSLGLFSLAKGAFLKSCQDTGYRRAYAEATPKPSDAEVDRWLEGGLHRIRFLSLDKLSLTTEECEQMEVPPIRAPVLWYKPGLDPQDLGWAKGADGQVRYGVYNVTFLWLAEHYIGIFQCDYNLVRDAVLNEETREFYYRDIVSVSTREEASALTLRTGFSLTTVQEFRIVVSGDQLFKVTVGASQEHVGRRRIAGQAQGRPQVGLDAADLGQGQAPRTPSRDPGESQPEVDVGVLRIGLPSRLEGRFRVVPALELEQLVELVRLDDGPGS